MKSDILFPVVGEEAELPFFVRHIGSAQEQCRIVRENGYWTAQLIYCVSGSGVLKFGDECFELGEGCCFFLPRDFPHEYYPKDGGWRTSWIGFSGKNIDSELSALGLNRPIVLEGVNITRFDSIFRRIFQALRGDKLLGGYTASACVYELLIEFCKLLREREAPRQYIRSNNLRPVLEYIDENLDKAITLEDLSALIGVTPQHLCRIFRECLGTRPFEYISRLRIQAAKRYLVDNRYPISEIAKMAGFNNTSYFCLIFKRSEGLTPTEFRELNLR